MNQYKLLDGVLSLDGRPLLVGLPNSVTLVDDPQGVGVFVRCVAEKPLARHVFALGELRCGPRLTFAHRYEPFWMKAAVGVKGGDVLPDTQFLLCEWNGEGTADAGKTEEDGEAWVVLFVPILDGDMRASLQGSGEYGLELVAETGDPAVCADTVVGLFIAAHTDPYLLMERAAPAVMARMQTGRLRRDKPLPAWIDDFGWCTWDAFYQEVSQDKVRLGLESFRRIGVSPRLLILDDGWQSVHKRPSGEQRLTAFAANERFPGGLASTVQMTKQEYGVKTFLVWHALHGYWGGVDEDKLPGYEARGVERRSSPGIVYHQPAVDRWWGPVVGVVSPRAIYRFYQDYHRHLRLEGVDGVKVDSQGTLESVSHGSGGRVSMMRHYHAALEGSVHTQFGSAGDDWERGNSLINCMSCSSEMLYSALASTLTRTSTDFWPKLPASHGEHLYINALVSLWFGEFIHPDWDMFQSGHEMGAFHAMGRAVGGCQVYVSDKPNAHNADILRKLVFPDGTIARASDPGRPTRDCLFYDPTKEDVLLKIFNRNNMPCDASDKLFAAIGVIGVFNARYHAPQEAPVAAEEQDTTSGAPENSGAANTALLFELEGDMQTGSATSLAETGTTGQQQEPPAASHTIRGYVSPADVHGLQGERFAVYRHGTGEVRAMLPSERWEIELSQLTGDVFTASPIQNGFAPIGITDMYNSGRTISYIGMPPPQQGNTMVQRIWLRTSGRFAAWCEKRPARVTMQKQNVSFEYDEAAHWLQVTAAETDKIGDLIIEF